MSGMTTQVQFIVAEAKDALLLPTNLLGKRDAAGMYQVNVLSAERRIVARHSIGVSYPKSAKAAYRIASAHGFADTEEEIGRAHV